MPPHFNENDIVNQILDMLYESDALVNDDGEFKELIYPYNNH